MSRDSETIRQLCVSLEAMTLERDEALLQAERVGYAQLLKEVRDVTAQRDKAWDDIDKYRADYNEVTKERNNLRAALEQERLLRVAADDALSRLSATHEAVTKDWDALRDDLATLIDETFGLKRESTLEGMLTALKEGIRRLSREANAIREENLRLKEAGIVPPEGPGCLVEAYVDECARAPAVALYPKDRSNGRWTTLDRFLDAVSEEFPEELIAAAERLKAIALLDASGEIDRHRPEPTGIVGKWVGDTIVKPDSSSCRMVSEEGDRFVEFKGGGATVWEETTNVIAILERAGRLPMVLDKETRAKLALMDWSHGDSRWVALDAKNGACAARKVSICNGESEYADTAVALCEKLGVTVPDAPAAHLSKGDADELEAFRALFRWTQRDPHRWLSCTSGGDWVANNGGATLVGGTRDHTPQSLAAKLGAK